MCVDQQLSDRRLRRRKTFRKVRRTAERHLGIMQARQHKFDRKDRDVFPDGRLRLRERAIQLDILEDSGRLTNVLAGPSKTRPTGVGDIDTWVKLRGQQELEQQGWKGFGSVAIPYLAA